jgi:hypothetical protein
MKAAPTTGKRCPDCNGSIEIITQGRGRPTIERCYECGRDIGAPKAPAIASPSPNGAARPFGACSVKGCPGQLDASGKCPCCVRRQAFADAHAPKRNCKICDGQLSGRQLKLCDACKPIQARVNVAKAPSNNKAKR